MAISNKKRKAYLDWLYTKKEQKQILEGIKRHRERCELYLEDFLLLDEQNRILKRHFKLTDKQASDIVEKYRIPTRAEEKLLKLLHGK